MWIDIVFIAIIIIFAIIGLVKGLFDSILSLCASVASIFLSFWASKPVAEFLNKLVDVNGFFRKFLENTLKVPETGVGGHTLDQLASVCTIVLSMIIVFVLIKAAVWLLAKLFDSVSANSTARDILTQRPTAHSPSLNVRNAPFVLSDPSSISVLLMPETLMRMWMLPDATAALP